MEPVKAPAPLVIISSSPYIHCGSTISAAMRDVLLSLLPALAAAVYFFGWPALSVILTCCLSAVICEAYVKSSCRGRLPSVTAVPF